MSLKHVVLAISGGVDSAVAGLILKKLGYKVTGVFMKNWDSTDEFGHCSLDKEAEDAEVICKKLGIPFHVVNFVQEYWNEVFSYLLHEYQSGRTPNPDIYCNRFIKFNHFFNYAKETLNVNCIATGHYARTSFGNFLQYSQPHVPARLLKAVDFMKDQTFFLSQVPQAALQSTMFPLGDLKKEEVKKIASENGLGDIAAKDESTGICFIGNRNFQSFIAEYIKDNPGPFVDIDSEETVGQHRGFHHWTIGQKARLSGFPYKYYTSAKDMQTNTIFVARGGGHLSLFSDSMVVGDVKWVRGFPDEFRTDQKKRCHFRFQHTKPLVSCSMSHCLSSDSPLKSQRYQSMEESPNWTDNDSFFIKLDSPLRALTPGQFAVLYEGEECLGSAVIERVGPSIHDRLKDTEAGGRLFDSL